MIEECCRRTEEIVTLQDWVGLDDLLLDPRVFPTDRRQILDSLEVKCFLLA